METGEKVRVNPAVTGLDKWIEATVIDVEKKPFRGIVISVEDENGIIFFDNEQYFEPINERLCLQ